MWRVLAAQGREIAAGFREPVTRERVRAAALDGSIEAPRMVRASAGDTFFVPAGTVRDRAGLTICEIQQGSTLPIASMTTDAGARVAPGSALAVSPA
jgi:mannose-6-phosphate isomerase